MTNSLPGIGGCLRAVPEHFEVEEVALYPPSGNGQHLYVNVTKVGLTTKDLQRRLARILGKRERDIGFAGMKDKDACTTQTFSVTVQHSTDDELQEMVRRIHDGLEVTINWVDRHANKLRPGHLLGNRFRITISALSCNIVEAEKRANEIAKSLKCSGLPNYFGPQRFGRDGRNVEKGLAVIKRQQYVKDRWLRRFLISAYQSYLCNLYLGRRLESGIFGKVLSGDIAKKYDTGGLFEVVDVVAEQRRYLDHEISFTAPLFGPKMRNALRDAGALEETILNDAPITLEELAKVGTTGTRRLGRLLVPDLAISQATDARETSLIVEFFLPKGAFATTVLGELMKVDLSSESSFEPK